jgi:hypothetical protein
MPASIGMPLLLTIFVVAVIVFGPFGRARGGPDGPFGN